MTPIRLALSWQVKVRGVRVSLVEVEFLACKATELPAGAFAVVYDQGTENLSDIKGDNPNVDVAAPATTTSAPDRGRLLGFFIPNETRDSVNDLTKLRLQLAEVMTPSQLPAVLIPVIEGFPLTTTGKVSNCCCP